MTKAGRKALMRAAKRERANLCPIVGVHAAAQTLLIDALDREGLITWEGDERRGDTPPEWVREPTNGRLCWGAPYINAAGRAALTVTP